MNGDAAKLADQARARAYSMPIGEIRPADPEPFASDTLWPYFERLRKESPVHYAVDKTYGPYWSVTRYQDIVAIESDPQLFSSEPHIMLGEQATDLPLRMFISLDPPKHTAQRKTVSSIAASHNLLSLEPVIRRRAAEILDQIAIGDELDWVSAVSVELTNMTLAVLLDFPWEDRRKLTRWSNIAVLPVESGIVESRAQRRVELLECLDYFQNLWRERVELPSGNDLISLMAHDDSTRNMDPMEFLGNLVMLIVAGNDTTRNSISGSIVALNQYPDQYVKLRANSGLVASMVSETIRWQCPAAYMRRTTTREIELGGKTIGKGEKILMWYVSGNRDEAIFPDGDRYDIERANARRHLSFGFGIHRCLGSRLAEMQLKVIWEEILKRFSRIEMTGMPRRVYSSFSRGYESLPVRIG